MWTLGKRDQSEETKVQEKDGVIGEQEHIEVFHGIQIWSENMDLFV